MFEKFSLSEKQSEEFKPEKKENRDEIILFEKEVSKEKIESLPDWTEPGTFYRGVKIEDAISALFGELKLEAEPKDDILGTRDNATLNLHEAIYFSPMSKIGKRKFSCAIGFDPLPGAKIEESYLGRSTFKRVTGNVAAKEIVVRFAGKKPGQPSKKVRYFSPKEFYQWYLKNTEKEKNKENSF